MKTALMFTWSRAYTYMYFFLKMICKYSMLFGWAGWSLYNIYIHIWLPWSSWAVSFRRMESLLPWRPPPSLRRPSGGAVWRVATPVISSGSIVVMSEREREQHACPSEAVYGGAAPMWKAAAFHGDGSRRRWIIVCFMWQLYYIYIFIHIIPTCLIFVSF